MLRGFLSQSEYPLGPHGFAMWLAAYSTPHPAVKFLSSQESYLYSQS